LPISDITWLNQLNRAKRPDHSKTYDNMTATTCFKEFIFLTEREKPIDESDVDSDGEIDSESECEQSEDETFRNVNKFVEIEYEMEYNSSSKYKTKL